MSSALPPLTRERWPKKLEIRDRERKSLYLTRWWLLGARESRWAIMLHKMHREDEDACHHDHPWWFLTLILWGGYVEDITRPDGSIHRRRNRMGMILYRPATHTHRIFDLPHDTCWTLVLRGRKSQPWGFHTASGWVHWREYIENRGAVSWCAGWVRKVLR